MLSSLICFDTVTEASQHVIVSKDGECLRHGIHPERQEETTVSRRISILRKRIGSRIGYDLTRQLCRVLKLELRVSFAVFVVSLTSKYQKGLAMHKPAYLHEGSHVESFDSTNIR